MGKGNDGPVCSYPRCQFDPRVTPACARVCKAFGTCSGPCSDPCYIVSAQLLAGSQDEVPEFGLQ